VIKGRLKKTNIGVVSNLILGLILIYICHLILIYIPIVFLKYRMILSVIAESLWT